jgi:EAL domain-containing protein (putative c-di-GMP-specific phosphodiesterase class I)
MSLAKERGREGHDVFDRDLHERTEVRQVLEQAVRDGISGDTLKVVYQPIVDIDIDSGLVTGAEALMRLTDRSGRPLPTLPSILAAEHAGLVGRIGDRVLTLALEAACSWPEAMTVAVNVSAREVTCRDFVRRTLRALHNSHIDPARLVIEVTESSILHAGPSALHDLAELRKHGVRIAIDDFGTAYATLHNLTVIPVDLLKIDAVFTAGLPGRKVHTAVVHSIIAMADELDIPCIVEGVESTVQLEALRGKSVHGQGWLWGHPQSGNVVPGVPTRPAQHDTAGER